MVNTVKFSEFDAADINDPTTQNVGLSSGVNTREPKFYTWTTAGRPATPFNGLLGLNTTLHQYEFWNAVTSAWVQFDDTDILPLLASHAAGAGASLVGLQNQSGVTNQTVQDLANAQFIVQVNNGSLQNAQSLGSLTTGIVKNTTVTGVLSISAPLTSIDGLTTLLGDILYVSAPNTYVNLAGNTTSTKKFLSQTGTGVISAAPAWDTVSAGDIVSPAALTKTDDTNVTLSLGGSPTVALLAATSLTLGWTGQLSVPRGGTGNSTFTAYSVICAGTTATGIFQNVSGVGTANQVLTSNGAGALPTWQSVPGLTPSALTKTDDTNVTLTLGGSPTVALLAATSLTLGWTGQLGLTRGGTNASLTANDGGIVYSTASALAILAGTATANLPLLSGSTAAPSWGAFALNLGGALTTAAAFTMSGAFAFTGTLTGITGVTFPTSGTLATTSQLPTPSALTKTDDTNVTLTLGGSPTVALLAATSLTLGWTGQLSVARGGTGLATITAHDLIIGNGTSAPTLLAPSATSGIPLVSQGAAADPAYSTAVVAGGGTGLTSATAYAVLCGGTTSTGAFQSIASVGTAGQVLTSNGAGALPTFQANGAATTGRWLNRQVLLSGTTYTPTVGTNRIFGRMLGGAGAGAGNGTSAGSGGNGGSTTFASSAYTAPGGNGANANTLPGAPGAAGTIVSASTDFSSPGSPGYFGGNTSVSGGGGNSFMGGAGAPAGGGAGGIAGNANTGAGGSGAGTNGAFASGSGGAAGSYTEFWKGSISGTYSYAIGAGGTAGTAGTGGLAGGAGGSGIIIIDEYS